MPTLDTIAKTVNGPNDSTHIGTKKLAELQDLTWGRLKSQEQGNLLRAARYILALFEAEPEGWVVTNGADTLARAISDTTGNPTWTDHVDSAVWYARHCDAELAAREDEDGWHIRKASDVRAMWAPRAPNEGALQRSTGAPYASEAPVPDIGPHDAPSRPVPLTLPVDPRSTEDLLRQFRAFVSRNVTQWQLGAGDHHHPIWQDLACAITTEDATFGPEWAYTSPRNRTPYVLLVEQFIDQTNEFIATQERGG